MPGKNEIIKNEDKIYNSRIFVYYIKLFRDKYPYVNISDILDYSGIDKNAIEDPFEWFSQNQCNRFFERIEAYFDNPADIAREAGRYVYNDKVLGLFKQFSLKLLGVGYCYKNIAKYANALTKSSTYSSKELSPNTYEVTVKIKDGVVESPYQEYNRLGILEAGPLIFSDKMAKVKSSKDGDTLKYIITWKAPTSETIQSLKPALFILFAAAIGFSIYFGTPFSAIITALVCILAYLILELTRGHFRYQELYKLHRSHEMGAEQIIQTYIDDYEQVNILNRIGRIILKYSSDESYLPAVASTLKQLQYRKIAFFITDFDQEYIFLKHSVGYGDQLAKLRLKFDLLNENYRRDAISGTQQINDTETLRKLLTVNLNDGLDKDDFPLVFVPIVHDVAILGFLLISPSKDMLPVGKKKANFLNGVAYQIGLGIHKQQAFYEIAESDRIKTEFISTASHELKTPIQIIMLGLSDLEQTGDIRKNMPPLKAVVGKLRENLNNLLSLQRIENKKYKVSIKKMRPAEIYETLKDQMSNSAKVFAHQIKYEGFDSGQDDVFADIDLFSTALMNLFNNSCKYTPKGGTIIFRYDHNKAGHKFSIIDNGLGIGKKDHDKVFLRFYQTSNSIKDAVGGIGLGLSIAKEIINLHHGDITVISPLSGNHYDLELNQERPGTCMTINLPKEY